MSDITVAGLPIQTAADTTDIISGLVWGPAGCGKSTLLGTLPGKKLWINFDPQGTASLAARSDVIVVDLSGQKPDILDKLRTSDVGGLEKLLINDPEINAIVLDSTTMLTQMCLYRAIEMGGVRNMTLETPGLQGYGRRNIIMLDVIRRIMSLAARYKKHFFCTAHEADPVTADDGTVLYITMMLGGQITNGMALRLSEIWFMNDTGKERRIAIRPVRNRKPMKSRMFDMRSDGEFVWKYDINVADHLQPNWTIAGWYDKWKSGNLAKLELPK